jgi:hypothetical protein
MGSKKNKGSFIGSVVKAAVMGVAAGTAAVVMTDQKKRKKLELDLKKTVKGVTKKIEEVKKSI